MLRGDLSLRNLFTLFRGTVKRFESIPNVQTYVSNVRTFEILDLFATSQTLANDC